MAYQFEICNLEERKTLCARATCSHDQIGPTIGELYGKIMPVMGKLGLQMGGPPFCKYLAWRESDCDIEAGCWIDGDGPKEGDVVEGTTPGGRAIKTRHIGPYEKLHDAYQAAMAFAEEQGMQIHDSPFEVYITDPGAEPDSAKWITDIYLPIA